MSRSRSLLLTVAAVLGTVCLALAAAGVFLDVRTLVFRSGSMGPDIPAGALGFARSVPAEELRDGDIVSVLAADGTRVTHRIVGVAAVPEQDDARALTLRGDANATPDAETYTVTAADRVFWSVPVLGYPVSWLGSPLGLILLGAGATGVLITGFARPRSGEGSVHGGNSEGRHRAAALVAVPLALAVGLAHSATGTAAAFSDGATVASGTTDAHIVVRPDVVGCGAASNVAAFAWSEKDPRYDYEIVIWRDLAVDTVLSTHQVTGSGVSRVYFSPDDFGLSGSLLGISDSFYFYAEVRSWLSGTSGPQRWQSVVARRSNQRIRIDVNCLLILLCTVSNPTCVA